MPITGQPGTPYSQPGALQPGYFCRGTAVWRGPFPQPQLPGWLVGNPGIIEVVSGHFAVTPTVASALFNSDPNWWEFH